jgi:hypothetical protein
MAQPRIPVSTEQAKHRPETERRAWVRITINQEISCQHIEAATAEEAETCWFGRVRNISCGGLALRLHRRFEPGTLLVIEWPDEAKEESRSFAVQVIHATAEGHRLWIVGCEFLRSLSEEELQALVGE